MSLTEVEKSIYDHYRFFAIKAPGVPVQETGHLARLWAVADAYYRAEESE